MLVNKSHYASATYVGHDLKRGLWHCVVFKVEEHDCTLNAERFGRSLTLFLLWCCWSYITCLEEVEPQGGGAFGTYVRPHKLSRIRGHLDM